MRRNPYLNGCDYLMLGFDHELRRHGFAGNACQIVLELGSPVLPGALRQRLETVTAANPILNARPGGLVRPQWKLPRRPVPPPVRVHRDEPALCQRLFNEPLAVRRGELARFDLVERDQGRMSLAFTWAHALMDAPAAEHFLAVLGCEESLSTLGRNDGAGHPPSAALVLNDVGAHGLPRPARPAFSARLKLAWKYLHHLDDFCRSAPRSLGRRFPDAPAAIKYRVERFSAADTARARENAARIGGVLGDAQFHAAVALVELHRLHQRLGCPSPSYVLPVAVGLRLKGSLKLLFSNQVTMLMHQFLPEHLDSVAHAIARLKTQTAQAMREGLLDSGRLLSEMFRFLPLSLYMAIIKQGLRGEICSLFYGETAAVNPLLRSFLGAPIVDFTHVAAVTPSPGIGVIFYYFRGELRVTVLYSSRSLSDAESAGFAADLHARLMNP